MTFIDVTATTVAAATLRDALRIVRLINEAKYWRVGGGGWQR